MQTVYDERNHVQEIHVEPGKNFLSEVFTDLTLPYGIFNKGKSGCGGTTVAIESPFNYIVFVPTIELIKNKLSQYKGLVDKTYSVNGYDYEIRLLGVHGNIAEIESEITQYISEQEYYSNPIKILATYDSASNLQRIMGDTFYSHCNILVDEMHSLMTEYSYRNSAIEKLLAVLTKHERVTYMSATPIAPAEGPVQLEPLPRHEVIWPQDMNTKIYLANTTNPICSVVELIYTLYNDVSDFKVVQNGKIYYPEQFFFYINSVKQISKVLEKLPEIIVNKVNIVCTDNTVNRQTLGKYADLIGSTLELKKYNLLTKKAFVGCDIYSPLGLSVIITDVKIQTNYLDPYIDILQIIGRIRNEENPFRDKVLHFTNSNSANRSRSRSNSSLNIDSSDDEMTNTENVSRYFRYKQTVHQRYKSIIDSYIESGQSAELGGHSIINEYCTFSKRRSIEIIYNILVKGGTEMDFRPAQKILWEQNPEIEKIINIFGVEKLKAVSFKLEKIKELDREESLEIKIISKLNQKIEIGSEYSRREVKDIMTKIYNDIGLTKRAKATDIKKYYEVQPFTRSGKPNVSCFRIKSVKSE